MGKSTILKLLMRFYDPDSGTVQYGNTDVSKIVTKELRKNVAYMTQDTFLFQDTILQNIKIANQDASEEQVIEAAKKASIHDFIRSLPQGYHTKVGELGDTLSGGERQRIGLARIFLHESDYIYLDEPTSNIDSLNEAIILKSLFEARENKTILLVSHRKSTMAIADSMITKN
jgi:ATP-binding cassette, subfamily C, bacterial